MKMNTFCQARDGRADHDMREIGLRIPTYGELSFVAPAEVGSSKPCKILYRVQFKCSKCGDGGLFDQDGNGIEYYQHGTVST